jgi:phosphatidate cytidylyltransferase
LNNFFRRTLTGAYIVIFIMGGFWLHPWSFIITALILLSGTQYEYYLMVRNTGVKLQMFSGMLTGLLVYTLSTLIATDIIPSDYFLVLIPVVILMMVAELYRKTDKPFDSLAHTLFGVVYTALPFSIFPFAAFGRSGLLSILSHEGVSFSPGIIIGFFLLIWANDTGAYLSGMSLGRHKLFERISPKKTWEGFFGGMIIAVAAAWLLSGWLGIVSSWQWVVIALIVSISGTYGDLIESMLKRSTGVKDSGTILPGHGGFLDRFDSALVAFPLVYLFLAVFG